MRIVLAGAVEDRDRIRRELIAAGFEIAAETGVPPEPPWPDGVDAVVDAAPWRLAGGHDRALARALSHESLTAREQDVLSLMAEGRSNKSIARELGISDQTVKFHVAAIIGKLGAANRTGAVRRAIRRGLLAI